MDNKELCETLIQGAVPASTLQAGVASGAVAGAVAGTAALGAGTLPLIGVGIMAASCAGVVMALTNEEQACYEAGKRMRKACLRLLGFSKE